jgi:hypothetical protein
MSLSFRERIAYKPIDFILNWPMIGFRLPGEEPVMCKQIREPKAIIETKKGKVTLFQLIVFLRDEEGDFQLPITVESSSPYEEWHSDGKQS